MIVRLSFILAVFCSIISQIPSVLNSYWGNPLKYSWILPAILLSLKRPKEYLERPICQFFLFVFCFGVYCLPLEAFSTNNYFGRDYYNMVISFLVFAVSYKYWKDYGNDKQIRIISFFIIVAGFILAYYLYRDYLQDSDVLSRQYVYSKGKNSASLIILCALLFPIINLRFAKKWMYVVELLLALFMIYSFFLLRSRAALVGLFYVVYYFMLRIHNKKLTSLTILITFIAIIWVLCSPDLYRTVVDGILFAGRDVDNLDELTSGRVYLIGEGWDLFKQSMLCGNGNLYLDCMPIVVLAQYGIMGGIIIFGFLIFWGNKIYNFDRYNPLFLTSFLFYNIFLLNSLFEAQPPFGPGIKCFMLWMVLGFSFAQLKGCKR